VVAGISNPVGNGATASITETLINTTTAPVAVAYTITPSTAAGCVGTPFTYTVTVDATPTVTSAATGSICSAVAQDYTITSSVAGTTFSWSRTVVAGISNVASTGNSAIINEALNNTGTTPVNVTYTIQTTSPRGCPGIPFTYTVTVNPVPVAPTTSAISYCQGTTSVPLIATGNNLLWYIAATGGVGSSIAPEPSTATAGNTTYYVSQTQVSPTGMCEGPRAALVVTINPTPAAPVTSDVQYCQGNPTAALTATGSNLLWYTLPAGGVGSSIAPTPSSAIPGQTTYYVSQSIISATGTCEGPRAPLVVSISAYSIPSVGITENNTSICKDGSTQPSVTFTASATNYGNTAPLYEWKVNGANVYSSNSGVYVTDSLPVGNNNITCTIDVLSTSGCFLSTTATSNTVSVQVSQSPTISLATTTPIIDQGGSAQLIATVDPAGSSLQWSADDGFISNISNPVVMPSVNTVYTLTVASAGACASVSDTISIVVYTTGSEFFMPNAFTPNGDGKDDVFRIPPQVNFALTNFEIFDRWGNKVFETSDIDQGWDGKYKGSPADIATYIYVITGNDLNGKVFHKGTVVLIR
jgi:gliding motility-associated-like protein